MPPPPDIETGHALHDEGGSGVPILLLHGLMGSARTWRRQVPWLRELGHVYTFDAAAHGRPAPAELTTEAFVADLAEQLAPISEPLVVIGHSMGALHGWCYAAAHPERVRALVVEDMAPDFRGGSAAGWSAVIHDWPQPFADARAVLDFFGPVAGQYFLDSFRHDDDGYRLHGDIDTFVAISEEWGTRDFWREWDAVTAPVLLLEGEDTVTPPGQMRAMAERRSSATYLRVRGTGHVIHDEAPQVYRAAVTDFLTRCH